LAEWSRSALRRHRDGVIHPGPPGMPGGATGSASVIGLPLSVPTLAWGAAVPTLLALGLLLRLTIKYAPIIGQKFEDRPLFLPLRVSPVETGQLVEFPTEDGLRLSGSYLRARTPQRAGVFVYCHEYLSDRWSFHPYVDPLRDLGFD